MPTNVPLEELKKVQEELEALEMKHPEAYQDFVELFKKHRSAGYKNITDMLMRGKTPQQLKDQD